MAKNVIELNGQKYDAKTGKPISHSAVTPVKPLSSGVKHLDGFSRRPGVAKAATVSHSVHKKTERSQTLMRAAVKKPVTNKIHAKTVAPAPAAYTPVQKEIFAIDKPGRNIRAATITKSNLISKFGKSTPAIKSEVIAVKPEPAILAKTTPAMVAAPPAIQAPIKLVAKDTKRAVKADPFKSAIENAVSHEQPKVKKARLHHKVAKRLHVSPRLVSVTGAIMAFVLVGGVLAYQNMPEISMKVAATRAGLKASLPSYQPSGFSLAGPIKYDTGEVTVNYKSNSDNRSFDVIQKNSSWNSETLLENYVAPTEKPYQTFQANGRTIYIYDGNKATWVDGGVWYNIDGKTNLNSDQLLRIADSL